jgi:ribonuclease R
VFDEDRKIDRIVPVERNDAHKLIEECMLLANESVAKHLSKAKLPTLYRVHEAPPEEKLSALHSFLGDFRLQLGGGESPKASDFARLISEIHDHPNRDLIEMVLLRSMAQASYSPKEGGHFGLAYEHYLHFTSPIRRYPDLIVHRSLKHLIAKGKKADWPYTEAQLEQIGQQCSYTERRADEAVRDATNWLKCEYLSHFIGDSFAGAISSVTSFGVFVQLDHLFVEGLIHVTELGDEYFHFDPVKHLMMGERTGKCYRLGDRVLVQVAKVNLDDRKIDFCFPKPEGAVKSVEARSTAMELSGESAAPTSAKSRDRNRLTKLGRFNDRIQDQRDYVQEIRALLVAGDKVESGGHPKPAKKKRRRYKSRKPKTAA